MKKCSNFLKNVYAAGKWCIGAITDRMIRINKPPP